MHIKHIHDMVEKLSETAKCELDKGIENVDTKEMGEVAEIIKELCEAEYYAKISKAMDEAEYGENYDYMGAYDDRKGYRGQPRDSRGRYMSRRSYESPMMMQDGEWDEMERMRDMDRHSGRMGYAGGGSMGSSGGQSSGGSSMSGGSSSSGGGSRGYSDGGNYSSRNQQSSRSENARRGYEETKMMNDNSPEGKKKSMESLEHYMKELGEDMSELIGKMDASEKTMLKNKLQALAQRVS